MNDPRDLAAAIGPVYTSSDLSTWLGVPESEFVERAGRNELLAVTTGDGHTVYSAWQFTPDRSVRAGVRGVLEALAPVMDDWTRALWCSGASPDLGGKSVATWLSEDGNPSTAAAFARRTAHRWSP